MLTLPLPVLDANSHRLKTLVSLAAALFPKEMIPLCSLWEPSLAVVVSSGSYQESLQESL